MFAAPAPTMMCSSAAGVWLELEKMQQKMRDQLKAALARTAAALESRATTKPGLDYISEVKDLEPELVKSLGALLPGRVEKNKKIAIPHWGTVGNVDLVVRREPGSQALSLAAELKWGKIDEALWDLLKMALLATREDIDAAMLITGASEKAWRSNVCGDLFMDASHSVVKLCGLRYRTGSKRLVWDWMLEGGYGRYPDAVPSEIATEIVAEQPVVRGQERWTLRAVDVRPLSEERVRFEGGWPFERPLDARYPLRTA
jgi:hypothetical protein